MPLPLDDARAYDQATPMASYVGKAALGGGALFVGDSRWDLSTGEKTSLPLAGSVAASAELVAVAAEKKVEVLDSALAPVASLKLAEEARAIHVCGKVLLAVGETSVFRVDLPRKRPRVFAHGGHASALSPDGERAASHDGEGEVTVFSTDDGAVLFRLGAPRPVRATAFSSRQSLAIVGQRTVTIHDGRGKLVRTITRTGPVTCAAWSPDGSQLATGGDAVRVWDASTGKRLFLGSGHVEKVFFVAWSDEGLFSVSSDSMWRRWDPAAGSWLVEVVETDRGDWFARTPDGRSEWSPRFTSVRWGYRENAPPGYRAERFSKKESGAPTRGLLRAQLG